MTNKDYKKYLDGYAWGFNAPLYEENPHPDDPDFCEGASDGYSDWLSQHLGPGEYKEELDRNQTLMEIKYGPNF